MTEMLANSDAANEVQRWLRARCRASESPLHSPASSTGLIVQNQFRKADVDGRCRVAGCRGDPRSPRLDKPQLHPRGRPRIISPAPAATASIATTGTAGFAAAIIREKDRQGVAHRSVNDCERQRRVTTMNSMGRGCPETFLDLHGQKLAR